MTGNGLITDAHDDDKREFDLVVFGANGLTGRLVFEQLTGVDRLLRAANGKRRWAVAGRNRERVANVLDQLAVDEVEVVVADLDEQASLNALADRAEAVINMAGPYTPKATKMIPACIEAGTSYVNLSGEHRCFAG